MWVLACCNSEGKCFGFLSEKDEVITDEERLKTESLKSFKTKADANQLCLQINLGHMLLPNGRAYRVVPVKA